MGDGMDKGKDIRYEALRMAQDITLNEYTDLRAKLHNRWVAQSDVAKRTTRTFIPYPDIPPYPTENDIISRAQRFLDFLSGESREETTRELDAGGSMMADVPTPPAPIDDVAKEPTEPIAAAAADEPNAPAMEPPGTNQEEINMERPPKPPKPPEDDEPTKQEENPKPPEPPPQEASPKPPEPPPQEANPKPPEPKMFLRVEPEEIKEYAKTKVSKDLDENSTMIGRMMPAVMNMFKSG